MRHSRTSRVARGGAAASAATFAALLSHVTAGGTMPGWLGIVVPWVLACMICVLLAGRALSLTRLSVSVAVSQLLFHTLFVLGAVAPASGAASPAHDHAATTLGSTEMFHVHAVAGPLAADPLMWLSHAFAAAVTIVALHRAEAAVRVLLVLATRVRSWLRRVARRFQLPRAQGSVVAPAIVTDRPRPHRPRHLVVVTRRGPPTLRAL